MRCSKRTITIIQKPMRRMVIAGNRKYFFSFPRMKFKLTFAHNKWHKKYYLRTLRVSLYLDRKYRQIAFLPNIFTRGYVCMGCHHRVTQGHKTKKELANAIISGFWSSNFTHEASYNCVCLVRRIRKSKQYLYNCLVDYFNDWERRTKEDPKWKPNKKFWGLR